MITMAEMVQEVVNMARTRPLARAIESTCNLYEVRGVHRQDLIDGVMNFLRMVDA